MPAAAPPTQTQTQTQDDRAATMRPVPNRRRLRLTLACGLVLLGGCLRLPSAPPPLDVADPPNGPYADAVRALRGTRGAWSGNLVVRDDAGGRLVVRPLSVANEVARDGLHLVSHRSVGAGQETALATDVTWVDPTSGHLHLAAFSARDHRDERYRIRAFRRADRWNWTLVAETAGEAAGAAGAQRVTVTRGGNRLSWRRDEVHADGGYRFRILLTLNKDES